MLVRQASELRGHHRDGRPALPIELVAARAETASPGWARPGASAPTPRASSKLVRALKASACLASWTSTAAAGQGRGVSPTAGGQSLRRAAARTVRRQVALGSHAEADGEGGPAAALALLLPLCPACWPAAAPPLLAPPAAAGCGSAPTTTHTRSCLVLLYYFPSVDPRFAGEPSLGMARASFPGSASTPQASAAPPESRPPGLRAAAEAATESPHITTP